MRSQTQLLIRPQRLRTNIDLLRKMIPKNEILFMVKANGYGHGMNQVSQIAEEEGIKQFGVATFLEAVRLRESIKSPIYVFSELDLENSLEKYLELGAIPVLSQPSDIEIFCSSSESNKLPLCLKMDTGMNRLGLKDDQYLKCLEQLKAAGRTQVDHLMSHFSHSYFETSHKRNQTQLANFETIKKTIHDLGMTYEQSSISNSGAIEQGFGLEESTVRPGLMLYGVSSLLPSASKGLWQGESLSELKAGVIKWEQVKKGTPLGYGGPVAPRDGALATLAIGYGDGISLTYKGAAVFCNEFKGQVIGRVSMDMTHVLFDKDDYDHLKIGKTVSFWRRSQEVLDLSEQIGTIPYEVFCHLGERAPRVYKD